MTGGRAHSRAGARRRAAGRTYDRGALAGGAWTRKEALEAPERREAEDPEVLRTRIGFAPRIILDVCPPNHAQSALAIPRDAALLLPCKVVLSVGELATRVSLQRPEASIRSLWPDPRLLELGLEVEAPLPAAIDALPPTERSTAA